MGGEKGSFSSCRRGPGAAHSGAHVSILPSLPLLASLSKVPRTKSLRSSWIFNKDDE